MHANSNVVTKLLPSDWLDLALAREEREANTAIQLHGDECTAQSSSRLRLCYGAAARRKEGGGRFRGGGGDVGIGWARECAINRGLSKK